MNEDNTIKSDDCSRLVLDSELSANIDTSVSPSFGSEDQGFLLDSDPALEDNSDHIYSGCDLRDDNITEEGEEDDDEEAEEEKNKEKQADVCISDRKEEDKPLYPGSPITVAVSMMLIMTFAMRHNLLGTALADLLTLIEIYCIVRNLCKSALKSIRMFFSNLKMPLEYHYYCNKKDCLKYIGPVNASKCSACSNDC